MLHNEPFVRLGNGERNLLSISPEVNTKAYHDAFMNMPVARPVAEAAYLQAGRILQKADGKDEEYLVAIDARTGALIADNLERRGYPHHTTFIGSELGDIQAHGKLVITLHNHPRSLPPSYQDVMTAARNAEIAGSIVLAHDGSVWYLSAGSKRVAEHLMALYNVSKDSLGDSVEMYAVERLVERARKVGLTWKKLR